MTTGRELRQRAKDAAISLAKDAPRISLTEEQDNMIDEFTELHFDNQKVRWDIINSDPNKTYRPPNDIRWNLMVHRIAAEVGVTELLDMDYLPRHKWRERKILAKDSCGFICDTELRVEMRILGGANGIYLTPIDVKEGRIVVWADVRLMGCECALCNDSKPRPETRVRVLGGVRASQELYDQGKVVTSHKNDDDRFLSADMLLAPHEILDDDGYPLIEKNLTSP
jgi:hypothetical protein